LDRLDEIGPSDDAIVTISSDNGFPEHLSGSSLVLAAPPAGRPIARAMRSGINRSIETSVLPVRLIENRTPGMIIDGHRVVDCGCKIECSFPKSGTGEMGLFRIGRAIRGR
jgi:hypothetical protein